LRQTLRSARPHVEADATQLLQCRRIGQHLERVARHALHDGVGRSCGRVHALEGFRHEAGKALLLHRRHIGQVEPALVRCDGERAQGAGLYVRMGRRQRGDADRRGLGEQRLDRRPRAVVGDVLDRDAGLELQQFRRQVRRRALAGIDDVELLFVGLRFVDQLLDRGEGRGGMDQDDVGRGAELGDRQEILERIVAGIAEQARIDHETGRRNQERVAVGR
jgi:hypothetical protein